MLVMDVSRSLAVLDRLVKMTESDDRILEHLRPIDGTATDWFMHVPQAFNPCLDIRQTARVLKKGAASVKVWTQGSAFSFSAGDTLYDSSCQNMTWRDQLQVLQYCFQITQSLPAFSATSATPRGRGSVSFNVLVPNESRDALIRRQSLTVTQDDFVRILIAGHESMPKNHSA